MARVFVIGATGGVGARVAGQLAERGDDPIGLYRHPEQVRALHAAGVEPIRGDLTTIGIEELALRLGGVDAVVFTAGAPEGGTREMDLVDGHGVVLATAAAAVAGVRRFLHVSAFPDAWRDRRMPAEFEHYMKVKRQADVHVAGTELDWAIVRPGTLTNAPATGRVRLGLAIPYGEVPRGDGAGVLVELVHRPDVSRMILELTSGATPIQEAVVALAHHRQAAVQRRRRQGFS
jgi:uncharacterized protein YbjT (DUF2867 family)